MKKQETKQKSFKLHFIGHDYYTQESFEREALHIGVQRAISYGTLKTLKFGDRILLANYQQDHNERNKKKKIGIANVFGYFTLTGISHNLPLELAQQLFNKLDDVQQLNNEPETKVRACGSYVIGASMVINNSLDEVIAKIEQTLTKQIHTNEYTVIDEGEPLCTCKKCVNPSTVKTHDDTVEACFSKKCKCCTEKHWVINPNEIKWFLVGRYTPLTHFQIKPIIFTRGLKTVELEGLKFEKQRTEPHSIIWLSNYKKRKYLPTYLKADFGARPNPQFNKYFGVDETSK